MATRARREADAVALERRVRAIFFAYFCFVGVHSPYLSLYLASIGYSVASIGVLMSVPQALRIVAPMVWGALADRHGGQRLLLAGGIGTALAVALLPLAAGAGYAATIAVLAALFLASAGISPITESLALRVAGGDSGRYGAMRLWGSIGFVVAVASMGPLLDRAGISSLPWWMLLVAAGIALTSVRLPPAPVTLAASATIGRFVDDLRQSHVAAFFAANFLMIFAHGALYVLFSLYLERAGYSKSAIGLFWTLGVLAEIVLFRVQRPLFERVGAASLLAASIVVAAIRFTMIGVTDALLGWLVLVQLMHGVTFGLHHSAAMALLHRWFSGERQARAQALYVTVAYGAGGTLGGLVASRVWELVSPQAAFVTAGVVAGVGALVSWVCVVHERRTLAA